MSLTSPLEFKADRSIITTSLRPDYMCSRGFRRISDVLHRGSGGPSKSSHISIQPNLICSLKFLTLERL